MLRQGHRAQLQYQSTLMASSIHRHIGRDDRTPPFHAQAVADFESIIMMSLISHRAGRKTKSICILLILAGSWGVLAGCGASGAAVRGQAPVGDQSTLAQAQAAPIGAKLTVVGTLLEKCPVAGCWFTLRDSSGTLRVDTKSAGFSVGDIALRTPMTVQGKVVRYGSTRQIQASGIRY